MSAKDLVFALRPLSRGAFLDLGENEVPIHLQSGKITDDGTLGEIKTGLESNYLGESFTALICAKVYQKPDMNSRAMLIANRGEQDGIAALFISDTSAATENKSTKVRFYKYNGSNLQTLDVSLEQPLDTYAEESPWLYYTVTYDAKSTKLRARVVNFDLAQQYSTTALPVVFDDAEPLEIGFSNRPPVAVNAKVKTAQLLIYNRALTDEEIDRQFGRDKFWMSVVAGISL